MHVVLRRGYSVPERVCLVAAGAASAGAVYPTVMHYTGGRGVPCLLLTLTGVPCPFCGLTTATVALAHGEWGAAAAASPLACLVALLTAVTVPVLVARTVGWLTPARGWSPAARRHTGQIMLCVVALSWLFQLHRFGFL